MFPKLYELYSLKGESNMPTVSVVEIDENGKEITDSAKEFQVDTGEILFDSIDNQGCKLPHGCLAGSCGSCRVLILEGEDNFSPPSVIEANTVENIIDDYKKSGSTIASENKVRLSCRARITGDVKIAPLKE